MKIYIVTMYRYGEKENHNYIVGAYTTKNIAIQNGNLEILWRGYKYYPEIVKIELNKNNDVDYFPEVVVTINHFIENKYE